MDTGLGSAEDRHRSLAGAAMKFQVRRPVTFAGLWLARHPLVTMVVLLVLLAAVTAAGAALRASAYSRSDVPQPTATPAAVVAPSRLPQPTVNAPSRVAKAAAKALGALDAACKLPSARRPARALDIPLAVVKRIAVRYPRQGLTIEGQATSTLGMLVVVRDELVACAPERLGELEGLLPADYVGG